MIEVTIGDKFVACWGYDQTQYSIYNVERIKGKFVFVSGLNSWSNLSNSDLAEGSQVKVYKFNYWSDLSEEKKQDFTSRGFDWSSYQHHYGKENLTTAKTKTIAKVNRIDGQKWTYIWTFTDGSVVSSDDKLSVEVVHGVKKCLLQQSKYNGEFNIKIDDVIRAYLDKDYTDNKARYVEQNEYTFYNGR